MKFHLIIHLDDIPMFESYPIHILLNSCDIYTYIWSRVPCSYPPQWYGSPGSTPFPSILQAIGSISEVQLVFARSLQRLWLPASHLLGTCHLLDDLRSTHTPSKYLRATYSQVIYTCAMYLLPNTHTHIYIHTYIHIQTYIHTYIHTYINIYINTYIYIYIYTQINIYSYEYT